MSKFRDETTIETFEHACPICHSDVKGDETYLYFCKQCNILFRKEDLVLDSRVIDKVLKQKIVEVKCLTSGKATVKQTDQATEITMAQSDRDPLDTIIGLKLNASL